MENKAFVNKLSLFVIEKGCFHSLSGSLGEVVDNEGSYFVFHLREMHLCCV